MMTNHRDKNLFIFVPAHAYTLSITANAWADPKPIDSCPCVINIITIYFQVGGSMLYDLSR